MAPSNIILIDFKSAIARRFDKNLYKKQFVIAL